MIINVAVEGTNGYFQDTWTYGNRAKPWNNVSPTAMKEFWQGENQW